ncbi:hypothetical protein B0H10DRAFT_1903573, partial [Mycena sp. CBHHK59/15]
SDTVTSASTTVNLCHPRTLTAHVARPSRRASICSASVLSTRTNGTFSGKPRKTCLCLKYWAQPRASPPWPNSWRSPEHSPRPETHAASESSRPTTTNRTLKCPTKNQATRD